MQYFKEPYFMKKKLIFTAVAAILVIGIVFGIVACNKNNGSATDSLENPFVENYVEMDYSEVNGYTEVEGLDAFDVLVSAYNSWVNNTAYRRIEAFDFVASVSTLGAHQQSMSVYKRDGEEFYKEDVTITTGVQTDNIGEREYYDGNKVYSIYFNDKNRAPGNEDNLFAVTDWGDFAEWQPGDILVYYYNGRVNHVALYLGNNQLMHALNEKYDTIIQDVDFYEKWDKKNTLKQVRRYR